jgi:hypothetical protein
MTKRECIRKLHFTYLMPLKWNEKKILHPVTVFQNLNTPLIIVVDAIHHMGVADLSMSESFMFQKDKINSVKVI